MIAKVFKAGVSRSSGPLNYLLGAVGRPVEPQVLRGDVDIVADLIDCNMRRWKYTSGVLAFASDDQPTDKQLDITMDDFESFMFAGKSRDTWEILWVRHEDKGNTELHYLVPRIDLETGQDLNIAPRGYIPEWAIWAESVNTFFGFTDPHNLTARTRAVRESDDRIEKRTTTRAEINKWVEDRVAQGAFASRDELIETLATIGEITRTGDTYISVKPAGAARAFRLKGAIYEKGYNFDTDQRRRRTKPEDRTKTDGSDRLNPFSVRKRIEQQVKARPEKSSGNNEPRGEQSKSRIQSSVTDLPVDLQRRLETIRKTRAERFRKIRERSTTLRENRTRHSGNAGQSRKHQNLSVSEDATGNGTTWGGDAWGNLDRSHLKPPTEQSGQVKRSTGRETGRTTRADQDVGGNLQIAPNNDQRTALASPRQRAKPETKIVRRPKQHDNKRMGSDRKIDEASFRIGEIDRRSRTRKQRAFELTREAECRARESARAFESIGATLRTALDKIARFLSRHFRSGPDDPSM